MKLGFVTLFADGRFVYLVHAADPGAKTFQLSRVPRASGPLSPLARFAGIVTEAVFDGVRFYARRNAEPRGSLIEVVAAGGGPVKTLVKTDDIVTALAASDGSLFYAASPHGKAAPAIYRVAAAGGQPERVFVAGTDQQPGALGPLFAGRDALMFAYEPRGELWMLQRLAAGSSEATSVSGVPERPESIVATGGGLFVTYGVDAFAAKSHLLRVAKP